jgi:hypothetical protein
MIENLFNDKGVVVEDIVDDAYEENTVLLVENDEIVAASTLDELKDAVLMVNSDLYVTGTRKLAETEVPDVIDGLAGAPFTLRGYPTSNSEKLLLVLISRHIERLAYDAGEGTLRSSFQRLSRIQDERGTREVYETVSRTDVDVHVYGVPDWRPTRELDVTMHGGNKWDFKNSWFVLYTPPDASGHEPAGLLAIQTGDAEWEGFWTYDRSLVGDLAEYVRHNL